MVQDHDVTWKLLEEIKGENRKISRSLRRQRWFWRGLTVGALAAAVMLNMSKDAEQTTEEK